MEPKKRSWNQQLWCSVYQYKTEFHIFVHYYVAVIHQLWKKIPENLSGSCWTCSELLVRWRQEETSELHPCVCVCFINTSGKKAPNEGAEHVSSLFPLTHLWRITPSSSLSRLSGVKHHVSKPKHLPIGLAQRISEPQSWMQEGFMAASPH